MAKKGGNPQNLKPFKPKGDKAFDSRLSLYLHANQKKALKSIPNYPDKLREAIDRLIESELGSAD